MNRDHFSKDDLAQYNVAIDEYFQLHPNAEQ